MPKKSKKSRQSAKGKDGDMARAKAGKTNGKTGTKIEDISEKKRDGKTGSIRGRGRSRTSYTEEDLKIQDMVRKSMNMDGDDDPMVFCPYCYGGSWVKKSEARK